MTRVIQTTTEATSIADLTHEWDIVARISMRGTHWEWCIDQATFDRAVDDGSASKVTGRDAGRLVLYGRRRG